MDGRLFTFVLCVLLPRVMNASCPVGEQYCSDRGGCISDRQNCSDGDILRCINTTAPCNNSGTIHCLDIWNYTCGNISCENDQQYCPAKKDCIDAEEQCCSEKDEACVNVLKYKDFFSRSETLNSICHIFAEDAGNFSASYPEYKYNDPLEKEMCDNGTYFCPLVLGCIPMNPSCNPDLTYNRGSENVFSEECEQNKTFCSLYMHCIPSDQDCSFRALFNWHDTGNMSVDPFSQSCPTNQSFCPITFSCEDNCERNGSMGNSSFTNVTDSTGSGWLETCKYRKLIEDVFWKKESECKPRAEKCQKKNDCDFEICYHLNKTELVWDEIKSNGSTTVRVNTCLFTVNASVINDCSITRMSCGYEKLCNILEEKMEHSNMSMNDSMWIQECNMTVNVSAKMHECNMSKDRENMSCSYERLCDILEEKMEHLNMSMNDSMWIQECNMTANVSAKMRECNMSKDRENMSCSYERFCDILEEKMQHLNVSMNDSMWIKECNMTVNFSAKMRECNMSKDRENKSCDIHELCDELADYMEEYENGNMTNTTVSVEDCDIRISEEVYQICKKNRSCEINSLCKDLKENNYNESKINTTIRVEGCNVEFNQAVIDACGITFHHCKIEDLCPKYRELAVNHTKRSFPKMFEGCKVDWNEMEQCNITFKNDSCEVHKLCHLLDDALERYKNGSAVNETVSVANCNIMIDQKVYYTCGKHSCELSDLCKPLRKKLDMERHWSMNSTIEIEMCHVTLNFTVLEECNITMKKNESKNCKVNKLCKVIRENNYNSSMVNKTNYIEDCEIVFDKNVLDVCNITFKTSCKVEDLCSRYRELGLKHNMYSFPKYIGKCKVNIDDFEQCNVTLQELNEYRYHIFYNGFKISDSIKNVSFLAIRGADVGSLGGHWEYENDGAWRPFDSVSSDHALVLASTIPLRFLVDAPSWYGVAILMYTPVESGPTGSRTNVSDILHDPRNTLALLQYPSRPMANVTGFTGDIYTVGEDEDDGGFMVDKKIEMNLSHTIMDKSVDENMTDYLERLDSKIVEEFNETVKCFKQFEPAVAIVEVGKSSQGTWKVNDGKISSATFAKPKVVAPHDWLRFMSAKHVHGNWSMKFVAVAYSNCSRSVKKEYFDAPAPLTHALKGVMMTRDTSKQVRNLLESALEEMASRVSSYSLTNFNGAVESLSGSTEQKNEVKDIFAEAFETVTLINEERPQGLPRFLDAHGSLVILNNPTVYTIKVRVAPRNDQPEIKTPRIILPPIAYNLTTTPNSGKLVKYLLSEAMATDIDKDELGIAIVEALSTSIGSWQYKAPFGAWTQVIVDNHAYTDGRSGSIPAFVLNSSYTLRFQMHNESILWNNLEASQKSRIVFLPSDGSDGTTFGRRNISRPSEATSAYGKKSVTVIAQRLGCDGRAGSKGRIDLCGVCGGDGKSCVGCDGVLNSGAIYDECGNCTGGNTNLSYNDLKDCANECGLSELDKCGICQRKGKFVNFTDCTGTCSGQAEVNECGYCVGGTSGKAVTFGEDACGICGGDNSTCTDCEGVPNGGKSRDFCDNCLLPSDSRWNQECVKLKKVVPNSGPSSGGMKVLVLGAGLKTYSRVRCTLVHNATNSSHEISSSSFAENGGRVIQFVTPPLQAAGFYTIQCLFDSLDVTHSVEETFIVYNKSAIAYTSISPDSIDINTAETAVIEGSGFVNTSDIACVSLDGRVFEAEYESSTRVSCLIPATKYSVRLSLGISFSRGDRRLGVNNNLNFTIYANASIPTRARFLNSLRGIVVNFHVPTKAKVRSTSCSEFFPSSNVSLFGSRSKCFLRTSVEMIILLRGRPAILPNHTVMFKLASVTRRNQRVTKEPTGMYKNLVIGSPTVSTIPVAKLTGTSVLGLCAKFLLNAAQSYGGGGRRLTFIYDVVWNNPADSAITDNATANLNETRQYLKRLSEFTSQVKAEDNSMIVVGPAYKFTLKVKNFLGEESEKVSFVITREDKTLPGLRLGSKKRNMKAALGITLQGKVELSKCLPAGYKPKVLFTWEIQAVGINLEVTDKSRLYIPPGLLQGDKTYTLTLTAAMESDITLATTATVVITVESSPLNAVIKGGGSLVVGEDETIVLDALRSSDPDRTSETATYDWYCFDSNDNPCFEPDPSSSGRYRRMVITSGVKATINVARQLKTNSNYKFVLLFKKGNRQKKASVDVIVKSGSPPMVQIFPPAVEKVNPTDVLIIESLIISKKTVNATWTCVQSEEYGFVDLEDKSISLTPTFREFVKESGKNELFAAPALVIAKNKLQDGVTYKFQLTAQHSDSSSFADVEITTNAAPSQGTLEIEPSSGFFGNTTFTLNAAEGWDDDADDLPMKYQLGYYIKDSESGELREELLGTPSVESSLEVDLLPQGDAADNHSLMVFVKVSDIYGAVTIQEVTVVVKPKPLDASDVNQLAGAVDSDFESGDLAKGAAKANAIVAALSSSNQNDPNTTKAAREFKNGVTDKVLSSVEGGGALDKSSKDVVKGSLLQMTSGCQPNCNALRVLRNLALMFVSKNSNTRSRRAVVVDYDNIEIRTAAEVEGILKISQNVINPEEYTNSSLEAKASFLSTVQGQEPSLCKGLATGGPYELAKTNITVMKAVKDAFTTVDTEFMEVSTSTAPQYIEATVTYRLGQTLKTQYESWSCTADDTCTGTCIATAQFKDDLLIQYNPAEKNVTRLSDVASIRLYNPQTLAEISVSGLANPVAFRFPVNHAEMYENYTKECRIWHEGSKEWQMSGCSFYSSNNSIVECRCTQLGYVAVFLGEEKLSTTAAPTTHKPTTKNSVKPEEAQVVEFAFVASYSQVISGNTTKSVFINHLRSFLAQLLNISQSRIKNVDIRSGSIIVTFTLLPSNDTNEASVNSTLSHFEQLVKTNNVNLTLPGSNQILRVDPSSFKIVMTTPSPTSTPRSDDDDGLSTAEIAVIAVVCAIVVIALIAALVYYFTRVKPGKISPHGSHVQLNERQNNNQYDKNGVDNAVDTDEKAV